MSFIQDSMLSYNQPLGRRLDLLEVYTEPDSKLTMAVRKLEVLQCDSPVETGIYQP